MNATEPNQFMVRAKGGTIFWSDSGLTIGVELFPGGGGWLTASDRNLKENFAPESGEAALMKIKQMPIESWNYKSQDASIRHLGPTAQDFHAAFGLGESETRINTVDIDGVNLLAIQALERRTAALKNAQTQLREKTAELENVKSELAEMKAKMARFESALGKLEALAAAQGDAGTELLIAK